MEEVEEEIYCQKSAKIVLKEGLMKIEEQMEKSVCKIYKKDGSKGTGFFCIIKYNNKDIPVMLTNYHIIDNKFIEKNDEIEITINDDKENAKILLRSKIIYTSKKYDTTIIELKGEKDKIKNYMKIDEKYLNNDSNIIYEKSIYIIQYSSGDKIGVSFGVIDKIDEHKIEHCCNTESGSSGSPIINLTNNEIIGIHIGGKKSNEINFGTLLKYPIKGFIEKIHCGNFNKFIKKNINISNINHEIKIRAYSTTRKNYFPLNFVKYKTENKENNLKIKKPEKKMIGPKEINIKNTINNRPKGLSYLGLNCPINSLLQCLYYIPELREYFIKNKNNFTIEKPICKAFAEVMYDLKSENKDYSEAKEFLKIMINKKIFKNGDPKDFYFDLINSILVELGEEKNEKKNISKKSDGFSKTKNKIDNVNIINDLFIGYYKTICKCKKCKMEFYQLIKESFILFDLEKISIYYENESLTIEDCFDYNYSRKYKNSFDCQNCFRREENLSYDIIFLPPKVMVLILDRGKEKRFRGNVTFQYHLDINDLIDINENKNKFNTKYILLGALMCSGDNYTGHYEAFCLNENGKYYHFKDKYVQQINEITLNKYGNCLLFYKRTDN